MARAEHIIKALNKGFNRGLIAHHCFQEVRGDTIRTHRFVGLARVHRLSDLLRCEGLVRALEIQGVAHFPQLTSNVWIDGAFAKGFTGCLDIQEGSRVEVGSDHDRVAISGT